MTNHPARRRFLQLAGTGAAASIAGCQAMQLDGDGADGDGATVTASLSPDEETVTEFNEAVQSGELDQEDADARAQEIIEATRDDVETIDGVSVDQLNTDFGLAVLSGASESILATLSEGYVGALYPGGDYEQMIQEQEQARAQQQARREQMQNATGESGGNETDA